MIKTFDKKGPHAGKFSVKYKDDSNRLTHSLLREGYALFCVRVMEKTITGFCCASSAVIPLEVTMTVSAGGQIFCFVVLLQSLMTVVKSMMMMSFICSCRNKKEEPSSMYTFRKLRTISVSDGLRD